MSHQKSYFNHIVISCYMPVVYVAHHKHIHTSRDAKISSSQSVLENILPLVKLVSSFIRQHAGEVGGEFKPTNLIVHRLPTYMVAKTKQWQIGFLKQETTQKKACWQYSLENVSETEMIKVTQFCIT